MKEKEALDKIINKGRVHFYKPFQIAEILRRARLGELSDLEDLESYRNISKKWRNDVSILLVGRVSTSSARYQDDVFNDSAMPPELLKMLGAHNRSGVVEAYIYQKFKEKLGRLGEVRDYLFNANTKSFSFDHFIGSFESSPGLKRSVDKIYEICVYALFSTIIRALNLQITLKMLNPDKEILSEFSDFLDKVVGIESGCDCVTVPAKLFRVGVTNAADRGLDMWCNFGPAVQVKHLTLTEELIGDISDTVSSDKIVIVCKDAEKSLIEIVSDQIGIGDRIQGIVTFSMLRSWYLKCLSGKFSATLGNNLIEDLKREFNAEFPSFANIDEFISVRGYDKISLPDEWK
jgi:hypothetical protein